MVIARQGYGFDAFYGWIIRCLRGFSVHFRKTHTGDLNYNIAGIALGFLLLLLFYSSSEEVSKMINPVLPFIFLLTGSFLAMRWDALNMSTRKNILRQSQRSCSLASHYCYRYSLRTSLGKRIDRLLHRRYTLTDGCLSSFPCTHRTHLGTVVCLYSLIYMKDDEGQEYYYPLLLLMVAGIVGIGLATDFLVLYLFFEMMSIPSYALVVFRRHEWMAIEAGMKYIVMGAVGSAFAFFGISLVYFQTGTLTFSSLIGMVSPHRFCRRHCCS